ncbi:MAG: hypothetical protein QG593_402 [Patescibacteria group bacterium]|nr:hypothetical protein [Patescibacteria group bacterium]
MKKIAIIEDDPSILEMYKIKFEVGGFEVVTALNGELGLALLEETKPDLVLLDLMMPKLDGAHMLVQLRKQTWGKQMPVIILTNISSDESPKILDELDVTDYIIKASSTPQAVFDRVESLLNKK